MDGRALELMLLAALSAFLCGTAFYLGHPIATKMFAALTCSTAVIAVALRRLL
jgi:hypothetical protein